MIGWRKVLKMINKNGHIIRYMKQVNEIEKMLFLNKSSIYGKR